MKYFPALCLCTMVIPQALTAEIEISVYGGNQIAPASDISVRGDAVIPDGDFTQDWEGKPFDWPIYAGFRVTKWQTETFGFGLDYTHNKTYPADDILPPGYDTLEFTDGLNTWTINAYRRWPGALGAATPYVGAGLGISAPGVEVLYDGSYTFEYQITGPAAAWLAGISYPINDTWAAFTEYKGTYTMNAVDLEGGGRLSTDIFTHAVNVGVSYRF